MSPLAGRDIGLSISFDRGNYYTNELQMELGIQSLAAGAVGAILNILKMNLNEVLLLMPLLPLQRKSGEQTRRGMS
ncbi:hypothetical protein [Nitrosomonas sp.]|uniref:hypothetical protein n=1 Tax=Nitrosomonas sp. TaxID=42353 RepID=UPI0025DA963F|nr:hypothetical protein [Nitrosomonas sp.]